MVTVTVYGEPRTLLYDWRAIRRLAKEHGINILDGLDDDAARDPETLTALVWAGLIHERPDLALDDVNFHLHEVRALSEAVGEAITVAMDGAEPDRVDPLLPLPDSSASRPNSGRPPGRRSASAGATSTP